MTIRISLTNTPPEGVRWQVLERGKTLRFGTANTEPEARAAAKEIETERFVLPNEVATHESEQTTFGETIFGQAKSSRGIQRSEA